MANLLTLKVLDGYTRPVISIGDDVTCLIDTGADIPVWTQGAEILEDVFKAELVNGKKFILSGFGREAEIVQIEHDKEEYAVGSFFNNRDGRFVERVYSFANEEKGYRENEGIEF